MMETNDEEIVAINSKQVWKDIPSYIKSNYGNDEQKWKDFVISYSISHQLRYHDSLVNKYVTNEGSYYQDLIQYSCTNLMIYPYHLQQIIIRETRISPYNYYCTMIDDQILKEHSYDCIPNFTATDCLQILGIGRNQFIDIVVKNRTNKAWPLKKKSIKHILPKEPTIWPAWDTWWVAINGAVTVGDIETLNEADKKLIDEIIDADGILCGIADRVTLESIYKRNLICFDVNVNDNDYFYVPKLENFVMNRVQGDYMETLMYKVFVSLDENTSLTELSVLLDADINRIKHAISIFCRLGMIHKRLPNIIQTNLHLSWVIWEREKKIKKFQSCQKQNADKLSLIGIETGSITPNDQLSISEESTPEQLGSKRIAFIYDSTLTAFLMVGNLSQSLKTYAMTMFEMGKLTHEMMDDFMEKLSEVEMHNEGEAKRFYVSAINLLNTLKFLRNRFTNWDDSTEERSVSTPLIMPVDMIHNESLKNLTRVAVLKLIHKKYKLLISMAPMSTSIPPVGCSDPPFFGPPISEFNSFWYKLFIYNMVGSGPPSMLIPHGFCLFVLPDIFHEFQLLYLACPDQPPTIVPSSNCLHLINEALKFSCVLLQAYSYDLDADNKLINIPFPLTIDSSIHPHYASLYSQLISKLNLQHGFGYISMIKHEKKRSLKQRNSITSECSLFIPPTSDIYIAENSPLHLSIMDPAKKTFLPEEINAIPSENINRLLEDERYKWLPFDVVYGMPLFNDMLNQMICDKIIDKQLFRNENTQVYVNKNRILILQLMDFVTSLGGNKFELKDCKVSNKYESASQYKPTKPLIYQKGKVRVWSIHEEL